MVSTTTSGPACVWPCVAAGSAGNDLLSIAPACTASVDGPPGSLRGRSGDDTLISVKKRIEKQYFVKLCCKMEVRPSGKGKFYRIQR